MLSLGEAGYSEVTLLGQNVDAYGRDLPGFAQDGALMQPHLSYLDFRRLTGMYMRCNAWVRRQWQECRCVGSVGWMVHSVWMGSQMRRLRRKHRHSMCLDYGVPDIYRIRSTSVDVHRPAAPCA